jgi:hypothetical protein
MPTYTITPRVYLIHDHPRTSNSLPDLFRDSHTMFKLRIQHLGNMSKTITDQDSHTLRLMLETLIHAKKRIQETSLNH